MNGLRLALLLAVRNLGAHKVKSAIVGTILFVGTFFIVVGSSLLDSIQTGMERNITSSVAGNLQIYSETAKDELAIFGGMSFGASDLGDIPDFDKVAGPISKLDNVAAVVPMGIVNGTVFGQNDIDVVLNGLRAAVAAGDTVRQDVLIGRVRRIVSTLGGELDNRAALVADKAKLARDKEALTEAGSDAFWEGFKAAPLPALDFLDGRIAPLATDGRLLYMRLIGTDLPTFTKTFDRFYVVDGEAVPPGQPGVLISKRTYEKLVKNKIARDIDSIWKEWKDDGTRISEDRGLQEEVSRLARQYQRITFQVNPSEVPALVAKLKAILPEAGTDDLSELTQSFLAFDDSNIEARHAFFYESIAPLIRLYDFPVGSEITLRSFTNSGYLRSVNVKVYGTYEFKGQEKSDLGSALNLVDLDTFRSLYGKMSSAQMAELADIRSEVGVKDISREDAEDELFGSGSIEVPSEAPSEVAPTEGAPAEALAPSPAGEAPVPVAALAAAPADDGGSLAINAAIVLKDPSKTKETQAAIEALSKAEGLGIQVIDWQEAAGLLGQLVTVVRGVLVALLLVIFIVALFIINNTTVMATMDRVGEIGTMRAIGAPRALVVLLFLFETAALGLVAGGLGAAAGAGLVLFWGQIGLPAGADFLVFIFAGPRLYPTVGPEHIAIGIASVLMVALVSAAYPALLASRIAPIVAMQGKE
jgi:ABC-type lipoprotein release transport system permease subunit